MQTTDDNCELRIANRESQIQKIVELTGYKQQDFSVCLGCKICASVCTLNDLRKDASPQQLLFRLFCGEEINLNDPLLSYCMGCYNCTNACPWKIRIPEIVRALREVKSDSSPFEEAFRASVKKWGRVYEPFVIVKSIPFLLKGGYMNYIGAIGRMKDYIHFSLPPSRRRK